MQKQTQHWLFIFERKGIGNEVLWQLATISFSYQIWHRSWTFEEKEGEDKETESNYKDEDQGQLEGSDEYSELNNLNNEKSNQTDGESSQRVISSMLDSHNK